MRRLGSGWVALIRVLIAVLVGVACLGLAGAAMADGITNAGDDLRTGWYPAESSINPQVVSSNTFGQLWSASVDGQVYAQPLLSPTGTQASPSGILVVATENDNVYGLDPVNGSQQWMKNLGTPFNPADIQCPDINPSIGTTATPVIDTSTNPNTVYMTHKAYGADGTSVHWFMDALNVATGDELPGWPVELGTGGGYADNAKVTFFPRTQQQRPGLLMMNGVVYAAFGSHCDVQPWQGWVFGVSTSTAKITAKWVDDSTTNGAGIWQGGAGLTSDGTGQILLGTGNGGAPSTPAPGNQVPASCGECVMRLQVQPDGTLKATDFFAPYDAQALDKADGDFGSGAVVGLPSDHFGTSALPDLAVSVGKEGYVYLLNRDDLGGYDQGPGAGDNVVERLGPRGGVYGRPGVFPGDNGNEYVYATTSTGQTSGGLLDVYKYGNTGAGGSPSLTWAGSAADSFGWGSGSPVITSDGTNPDSAVVWVIWSANRQGEGGQLRAYNPVPDNGQLQLLHAPWSIGSATNYSTPGVGPDRLYVGTRDGHVLGFGSPTPQPLGGSGVSFPRTTIGSSDTETLTMKASGTSAVTISGVNASPAEFTVPALAHSVTLQPGDTLSVQVTFTPGSSDTSLVAGQLTARTTDAGDVSFPLSGTGQAASGLLQADPAFVSLGGTAVGGQLNGTVTFSNAGATALKVDSFDPPAAPFSVTGTPPAPGDTIAPGSSVDIQISFDSSSVGQYTGDIKLTTTNGQSETVQVSASAATPGALQFSTEAVDFGSVPVGTTASRTFTITNTGGTPVIINKSKPPFGGAFAATPPTSLPEGTSIQAGQTVSETVTFSPTSVGPATSGMWQITGNDASGPHQVQFTGTGASPSAAGPPPTTGPPAGAASVPPPPVKIPGAPRFTSAVASTAKLAHTYITYNAMAGGVSHFVLQRVTVGRRGAHGCVAVTARNRSKSRCTRYVVVRRFSHRDRVGANRLRLGAYVALRKLPAGRYRLRSILLDSAGAKHTFYTQLRVITPPRRHHTTHAVLAPVGGLFVRLAALLQSSL